MFPISYKPERKQEALRQNLLGLLHQLAFLLNAINLCSEFLTAHPFILHLGNNNYWLFKPIDTSIKRH